MLTQVVDAVRSWATPSTRGFRLARYKHLTVKNVALESLRPERRPKPLTPRQQALLERNEELRQALNEAAALPASEAVSIDPQGGQKVASLRAALAKILAAEPRELNVVIRGQTLYISKGAIPSARGGRRN
jgi:hypothetical protein